jgi:2-polyprenyl-6-methoxyphenol hydroxylase-like FAD-dependent oxidoreductase
MVLPRRVGIAILGAGVAGCATAIALAASGVPDVAIFDTGRRNAHFRIGESLPAAARPLLRQLGVLDRITALQPLAKSGATVLWGKDFLGYNDAVFDPAGAGWHLDRVAFDNALRDEVAARGIPIFQPLCLNTVHNASDGAVLLDFAGAGEVTARLLVDASGVVAAGLRRLNVARNLVDVLLVYHAVTNVNPSSAGAARTFLEAVPYGWWYAARIPGNRMVAMLATDKESIENAGLSLSSPADFSATLSATRLIGPEVAAACPTSAWAMGRCSAATAVLSRVAGSNWVAVGDAAWSCDPLTAQGITKALVDGIAVAEALAVQSRGGRCGAVLSYQSASFARFTANLRLRAALYEAEGRWPNAPFWRKRRPAVSGS